MKNKLWVRSYFAGYFRVLWDQDINALERSSSATLSCRVGNHKVLVDIDKGTVMKGIFPFMQLKLVLAWCEIHRDELLINWNNAEENRELMKIDPLT